MNLIGDRQEPQETELSVDFCISRAAALLEVATHLVVDSEDASAMSKIADGWMGLARALRNNQEYLEIASVESDHLEVDEEVTDTEMGFGFYGSQRSTS